MSRVDLARHLELICDFIRHLDRIQNHHYLVISTAVEICPEFFREISLLPFVIPITLPFFRHLDRSREIPFSLCKTTYVEMTIVTLA